MTTALLLFLGDAAVGTALALTGMWFGKREERRKHEPAVKLLRTALHLRVNGEYAPGGTETWADWDRDAERFLRGAP